jgi:hypothetical protein
MIEDCILPNNPTAAAARRSLDPMMEDIFFSSDDEYSSEGGGGKLGLGKTDTADDNDGGLVEVIVGIPSSSDFSVRSINNAEATRYPFIKHVCHYMVGSLIGSSNCTVRLVSTGKLVPGNQEFCLAPSETIVEHR